MHTFLIEMVIGTYLGSLVTLNRSNFLNLLTLKTVNE